MQNLLAKLTCYSQNLAADVFPAVSNQMGKRGKKKSKQRNTKKGDKPLRSTDGSRFGFYFVSIFVVLVACAVGFYFSQQ